MEGEKGKNYRKFVIPLVVVILLLVLGVAFLFRDGKMNIKSDESGENFSVIYKGEIKVTSDGTKYIVDPSKIRGGGPPKGGIGVDRGIPALTEKNINFVSVEEADEWIEDNELVLALNYKGVKRIYPLQIMTWHEIANDVVAGDPLLITYCPLCGSGIAYERKIEISGERVESRFGTSGKLFNSNLVMYDEQTDTYWQQIDGLAIVGELTGQELKEISIDTVTWKEWKNAHLEKGDSEVLSQDTGMSRSYGKDPYANYFEDDFQFFVTPENVDDTNRIKNKEFVFGIEIDGTYKAYRKVDVDEKKVIEDVVSGVGIRIERQSDGIVTITNTDTGEEIVKEVDFWFAWYAFHPETELYGF
jgi:hypothetical protein